MGKKDNEDDERKAGFGCDLAPKIEEGNLQTLKKNLFAKFFFLLIFLKIELKSNRFE